MFGSSENFSKHTHVAVDHELLFAMLTKAQARQHHTDAETRYKNVDTNHTQTIHLLYTTHIIWS